MATTAELLTEAQSALHALLTGQAARVIVDQNGERVEFTPANVGRLRQYIAELTALLYPANTTRGPAGVFF